jgi:flagellar hook-basal body complex protein FliE
MFITPVALTQQFNTGVESNKQGAGTAVNFGEMLSNALNKVNEDQAQSSTAQLSFLAGEVQDIHQVTIAGQKAKVTLQLAVEVRNKMVEAYQEISRMHV